MCFQWSFRLTRKSRTVHGHYRSFVLLKFSVKAGGHTSWISDNSCDDVNNNIHCDFDGGDCCGVNVKKQFCFDCLCIGK